jgi:cation transport ATPase
MTIATVERSYIVNGMHCDACAQKISGALEKVTGVKRATVTFSPPEARLVTTADVATGSLNEAVNRIGAYRLAEQQSVDQETPRMTEVAAAQAPPESLYPVFLIAGYIAVTVGLIGLASGNYSAASLMNNFMAGFFLAFSFFKLLDLRGFQDAYGSYDLLAQMVPAWSLAYPFVELGLGISYVLRAAPLVTNAITLVVMLIGSLGVLRALLDKRKIRCACLGTALKLPMTKVTLVEDLTMAVMATVMLGMLIKS